MQSLAEEFHDELLQMYKRIVAECAPFRPTRFLQMVERHGGVAAAKRLLSTDRVEYGLIELWERSRLCLSLEAHVLKPRYRELFTERELEEARNRLEALGGNLDTA